MKIGIIAGEASGDLLAAGLITAIKSRHPDVVFEGIAGPAMIAAGCKAIFPADKLAVMGLVEVLAHYRQLKGIQNQIIQHFIDNPPDVFIGVDAPDFNLTVERRLKENGIKSVHYVSPSVWAWRQYRVRKIARSVDLMLTLFPFEAAFYKQHQIAVEYVGHPLADMISVEPDMQAARHVLGLPVGDELVALLPGSRISEVKMLAVPMIKAATLIAAQRSGVSFIVPFATAATRERFEEACRTHGQNLNITFFDGQSRQAMAAANVVMLASGTAALEALLLKKPMVVCYRVSALTYLLLQFLIKTKFVSLPNILAGHEVAKELLQGQATAENMSAEVLKLLQQPEIAINIVQCFHQIHQDLKQNASAKAADAVLNLIAQIK